jgi:hypothetical protein
MPPDTPNDTPQLGGPRKHWQVRIDGLPGGILGLAAGAVGIVLAVVFGLVLLAAFLAAGVVFGGYFWWNTRNVRKLLRERPIRNQAPTEREVEGEVIQMGPPSDAPGDRVHEAGESSSRTSPRD